MAYSGYGKAPDAWTETALISIEEESGNKLYFRTITDSVKPDLGEKGFDTIATISGGRLIKFTPETDGSVTLDLYPVTAGNYWSSSGEEAAGFYDLLHAKSATYDPAGVGTVAVQTLTNDHTRTRYRMTLMWTNATAVTDPTAAFSTANRACLRLTMCGYFTKVEPDFSDGIFKVGVTMKIPAFNKAAEANVQVASTDNGSTTTLPVLGAFTSTNNF